MKLYWLFTHYICNFIDLCLFLLLKLWNFLLTPILISCTFCSLKTVFTGCQRGSPGAHNNVPGEWRTEASSVMLCSRPCGRGLVTGLLAIYVPMKFNKDSKMKMDIHTVIPMVTNRKIELQRIIEPETSPQNFNWILIRRINLFQRCCLCTFPQKP